jgi:DNA-binding response OmpR family regulator
MNGTILIYGNEEMLVTTRQLILEEAGYQVLSATKFDSALVALVNERIDVLLLCQSLYEVERRSILETARAIKPDVMSVVFGFDGREVELNGGGTFERLDGPGALVNSIGRILHNESPSSDLA